MLVKYNDKEVDMLARLMRAEALSDGEYAMMMVGNVVINRVLATCDLYKNRRTIESIVSQSYGGFDGYKSPLYQSSSTTKEKRLAKRVIKGEYFYPATFALWFYGPGSGNPCREKWFGQSLAGRYKTHCFYIPNKGMCPEIR